MDNGHAIVVGVSFSRSLAYLANFLRKQTLENAGPSMVVEDCLDVTTIVYKFGIIP